MKPIKITKLTDGKYSDAVRDALANVNGQADGHTYTCLRDIMRLIESAERKLVALGLETKKKAHIGAAMTATSGDAMLAAYKYKRVATRVRIERKATGWYLTAASRAEIWQHGGGKTLILTPAQRDLAVAHTLGKFVVAGDTK